MILPEIETLALFMVASLALYISPGPDVFFIISKALGGGFRQGLLASIGVNLGITVHMLAAALGLAALVAATPVLLDAITWLGAAYLAYLGIRMLLNARGASTLKAAPAPVTSAGRTIREGLFVNLLNPKISLFFLAFLPQFADPALGSVSAQVFLFGALFNGCGFLFVLCVSFFVGRLAPVLARRPILLRIQEAISGSVLLAMAVGVALSARR